MPHNSHNFPQFVSKIVIPKTLMTSFTNHTPAKRDVNHCLTSCGGAYRGHWEEPGLPCSKSKLKAQQAKCRHVITSAGRCNSPLPLWRTRRDGPSIILMHLIMDAKQIRSAHHTCRSHSGLFPRLPAGQMKKERPVFFFPLGLL